MICQKLFIIGLIAVFATFAYASKINRLELAQLPERSEVTILAQVIKVDTVETTDEVTIKVASVLEGNLQQKVLKLTLNTRGVRNFDPTLKVGDTGVFFLKEIDGPSAKLAYWGSVAIFQKSTFKFTEE